MDSRDDGSLPNEAIHRAVEAVRVRLAGAEAQRAAAEREIAVAREEERLLLRLLAVRQGEAGSPELPLIESQVVDAPSTRTPKQPVLQAVIEELNTAGRPLHISELMRLLQVKNISVPGSGSQANLITHLRRDARFVRPSRGMYALAEWGLESMPTPRRSRRRKRVRSQRGEAS